MRQSAPEAKTNEDSDERFREAVVHGDNRMKEAEDAAKKKRERAQRRKEIAWNVITFPAAVVVGAGMLVVWGARKVGEKIKEKTSRVTHYSNEFSKIAGKLEQEVLHVLERAPKSTVFSLRTFKIRGPAVAVTQMFKGPPAWEDVQGSPGFKELMATVEKINRFLSEKNMTLEFLVNETEKKNPFNYNFSARIVRKKN